MRYSMVAAVLFVGGVLAGCDAKPDSSQTHPPSKTDGATPQAPDHGEGSKDNSDSVHALPSAQVNDTKSGDAALDGGADGVDTTDLPKEGPGDTTLTYDVVKADPVKYRGKRVTWAFTPINSIDAKRVMCALDMNAAIDPPHAGIYVVEFASNEESGEAFFAAKPGSTITATVVGQIDQFLAVQDSKGNRPEKIPKVTVPLLLHPTYTTGEDAETEKQLKN